MAHADADQARADQGRADQGRADQARADQARADQARADQARADQRQAAREADARRRLLDTGGASLPRVPWRAGRQPPAAADLIQFTVWRSHADATDDGDLLAALALLPAARAEADQVEAALLFTARARGLSWARISGAIGLGSPQAAQQRFDRVAGRAGNRPS